MPVHALSTRLSGDATRFLHLLGVCLAALGLLLGCGSPYPGPRSPREALESFSVRGPFEVEIFAAEPRVVDPVAIAFDRRGRMYAAEMLDYPFRPDSGSGASRVRLIEDADADGRADRSSVFADSLMEVTSIQPWKGGILVTAAPDILYLKDTDGDRRADVRRRVFTGFFTGNSEAQITNLRFDLTNWIYASNMGQTGTVRSLDRPEAPPVSVQGGDFRFRLETGAFERVAGSAQFGRTVDDFGRRFVTQNTVHVRQVVVPDTYPWRNPAANVEVTENVNDHGLRMYQRTPTPHWREVRTRRRNRRYDEEGLDRTEHARDRFTGASGGTIYAADRFPAPYRGNLFTGEVAGNLVHRDVLAQEGATFRASRAPNEQDGEFLASTDPWFRPSSLEVGPDGALYVVDMYRKHIESPYSIPEDLKEEMDFYAGDDRGRIYRIVPREGRASDTGTDRAAAPRAGPTDGSIDLGAASSAELVELLAHPNRWWRLTAQRLLLERRDRDVAEALRTMAAGHARPRARLHALYALEGLDALTPETVAGRLDDPHAGVREHAVRLAERYDGLTGELIARTNDPSARVAFQLALTLGARGGEEVRGALADLALRRSSDPWMRTALLTSRLGSSVALLETLRSRGYFELPTEGRRRFVHRAAEVTAREASGEEPRRLLALAAELTGRHRTAWRESILGGLAEGLQNPGEPPPLAEEAVAPFLASSSDAVRSSAETILDQTREANGE